jgi:hypothetical protein
MLGQQVLHTVDAEAFPLSVGEQHLSVTALGLAQPGFQHGDYRSGEGAYSVPCGPWRTRSTTANPAGTSETFRVTHPYHPLFGREYKLVTYCHGWGSHRVYFHDDAGRLRKIPACWTDVVAEDPFVVVAAGRSAFRVADLLMLADLIEALQPRRRNRRSSKNVSM